MGNSPSLKYTKGLSTRHLDKSGGKRKGKGHEFVSNWLAAPINLGLRVTGRGGRFGKKHRRRSRYSRRRVSKKSDHKRSRSRFRRHRRRSRRFGYSHDMGPQVYNAHMQDGILLADNAFQWMGNPLARALNAGSG